MALNNFVPQIPHKAILDLFQNLFRISDKDEVLIEEFIGRMHKLC